MQPYLRVRFERHRRNLSQQRLGQLAGIHQADVSLIEKGRLIPTTTQLERLAQALAISPPSILLLPVTIPDPEVDHEPAAVQA